MLELCFDKAEARANVLDDACFAELDTITTALAQDSNIRGLLISSAKTHFCLGADIQQFPDRFQHTDAALRDWVSHIHQILNRIEQLPFPCVAAVNGMALGGGAELALAADYRVAAPNSQFGFPEVTLGICPFFGGMTRFTHLVGVTAALDWMMHGKFHEVTTAQLAELRLVDCISDETNLRSTAIDYLLSAQNNDDYRSQRQRKRNAISTQDFSDARLGEACQSAQASLNDDTPATQAIMRAVTNICRESLDTALSIETDTFLALAKTPEAQHRIQAFLEQQAKKRAQKK